MIVFDVHYQFKLMNIVFNLKTKGMKRKEMLKNGGAH